MCVNAYAVNHWRLFLIPTDKHPQAAHQYQKVTSQPVRSSRHHARSNTTFTVLTLQGHTWFIVAEVNLNGWICACYDHRVMLA